MIRQRPQLLVSVRSVAEARAALAGGPELIDIKEPSRGSLGAADEQTIGLICDDVSRREPRRSLSVALGELHDWTDVNRIPTLPGHVEFAKVGLSHCLNAAGWPERWMHLRDRFDEAAGRPLGWIAVSYADATASGPPPGPLIDLAATTGCRGILIDTFQKESGRLFDHVTPKQLSDWRTQATAAGLLFAVAGSLHRSDLPRLVESSPDIVAVRSAACRGTMRTETIEATAVRSFREAMRKTWRASC